MPGIGNGTRRVKQSAFPFALQNERIETHPVYPIAPPLSSAPQEMIEKNGNTAYNEQASPTNIMELIL